MCVILTFTQGLIDDNLTCLLVYQDECSLRSDDFWFLIEDAIESIALCENLAQSETIADATGISFGSSKPTRFTAFRRQISAMVMSSGTSNQSKRTLILLAMIVETFARTCPFVFLGLNTRPLLSSVLFSHVLATFRHCANRTFFSAQSTLSIRKRSK